MQVGRVQSLEWRTGDPIAGPLGWALVQELEEFPRAVFPKIQTPPPPLLLSSGDDERAVLSNVLHLLRLYNTCANHYTGERVLLWRGQLDNMSSASRQALRDAADWFTGRKRAATLDKCRSLYLNRVAVPGAKQVAIAPARWVGWSMQGWQVAHLGERAPFDYVFSLRRMNDPKLINIFSHSYELREPPRKCPEEEAAAQAIGELRAQVFSSGITSLEAARVVVGALRTRVERELEAAHSRVEQHRAGLQRLASEGNWIWISAGGV